MSKNITKKQEEIVDFVAKIVVKKKDFDKLNTMINTLCDMTYHKGFYEGLDLKGRNEIEESLGCEHNWTILEHYKYRDGSYKIILFCSVCNLIKEVNTDE